MDRVIISGIGLLGPASCNADQFWESLTKGPPGIGRISRFDCSPFTCQFAGEVQDRSYEGLLDPRILRTTTHSTQLALAATEYAFRDARLSSTYYAPERIGICIGTALGGWREAEQQHAILLERGARRVNPLIANATPNHSAAAAIAEMVGACGPHATFSSGCPASLQAISYGASLVASGEIDICIAGGTESPLIPSVLAGMGRTQELSTCADAATASCPFDKRHLGLVPSEGSCILVLEAEGQARRRGAIPYADVHGGSSSCDARGLYSFDPSGAPGAYAIHALLNRADVCPQDIDYICAHANSSPAFDRKEIVVLKRAFGATAPRIPLSSIKAIIGHPFGASGAFQVAATCLAFRSQTIPPTFNLQEPDPLCDLDCVPMTPRRARLRTALVTSYGYGGFNAYLLLSTPGVGVVG